MADKVFDDLNNPETVDKSGSKDKELLSMEAIWSSIYSDAGSLCLAKDIMPPAMEAARRGLRSKERGVGWEWAYCSYKTYP